MNIYEYQAKEILKSERIPVPAGIVAETLETGLASAQKLCFPVVIKAQVHTGGRGKAGGIRIVSNKQEIEKGLTEILNMTIKGLRVKKVLIEKALDIKKQFYLGITVDRSKQGNVIMASSEGGIEIEEVAKASPGKIIKLLIKPSNKLEDGQIKELVSFLELPDSLKQSFIAIVRGLLSIYLTIDAQLVEINPLILNGKDEWVACDAKIIIDDNALFKHEELKNLKEDSEDNELEKEAHKRKLAYVKLSGNIGIIGNGAGLVMATMDEVKRVGGKPADFLDIGGGAKKEVIQNALEIIYMDKQAEGIFINVFGGITRCDEVAKGIIEVMKKAPRDIPVVLRLAGTQAEKGRKLLEKSNLISAESMGEGAKRIVSLVEGKNEHSC